MDTSTLTIYEKDKVIPKGLLRRKNKEWIKHVMRYVDNGVKPKCEHKKRYKRYIKEGHGDDWFMDM